MKLEFSVGRNSLRFQSDVGFSVGFGSLWVFDRLSHDILHRYHLVRAPKYRFKVLRSEVCLHDLDRHLHAQGFSPSA